MTATLSLLLTDATTYTQADLNQIVAEQLERGRVLPGRQPADRRDVLRRCVMTPAEWVAACARPTA